MNSQGVPSMETRHLANPVLQAWAAKIRSSAEVVGESEVCEGPGPPSGVHAPAQRARPQRARTASSSCLAVRASVIMACFQASQVGSMKRFPEVCPEHLGHGQAVPESDMDMLALA